MVNNEEPLAESNTPDSTKEDINTSNTKYGIVQHQFNVNAINLFDDKQVASAENFMKKILRSDKGGIKSIEDGFAVLMRAQALNIPFATSLEHIHVINGKTGIDIHIVKALLLKAGVTWECIKDYAPLYEYTDGINVYIDNNFPDYVIRCTNQKQALALTKADTDKGIYDNVYVYPVKYYKDFKGNVYKDYQLNTSKFTIVTNIQQATEVAKTNHIPIYRVSNQPVDFICEYKFYRTINGKEITTTSKFTYNDALIADLFSKDTYKKYPKVLISHRAFTLGARDIASDVLLGAMESSELKIVEGKSLDDGDIQIIDESDIEVVE